MLSILLELVLLGVDSIRYTYTVRGNFKKIAIKHRSIMHQYLFALVEEAACKFGTHAWGRGTKLS